MLSKCCIFKTFLYLISMALHAVSINVPLEAKGATVYHISVDATVDAAVAEMNQQRIGSILVKDLNRVVGIFTERDVLTRVVALGIDPKSISVQEVMTTEFKSISCNASVEDAMQIMTDHRVRHLPVFDGDQLLGLISIGDLTSWLLKVNEIEADNLRRYIFDDYPA